jgi:hypothetical protein
MSTLHAEWSVMCVTKLRNDFGGNKYREREEKKSTQSTYHMTNTAGVYNCLFVCVCVCVCVSDSCSAR